MNLIEYFLTKTFAQGGDGTFGGGSTTGTTSGAGTRNFTISDFNFLNPIKGTDPSRAFDNLFSKIVGWTLTIAAIVAFFYLIFAGFQYITAGGDAAKAQAARTGIVNALIGIIIILISYVILRYVGTNFVN